MHRRRALIGLVLALSCASGIALAQVAKQYRVAYLSGYSAQIDAPLRADQVIE